MKKQSRKSITESAKPVYPRTFEKIIHAECWDPFAVLGPHEEKRNGRQTFMVRAFLPDAASVVVLPADSTQDPLPMQAIEPKGFFEATCSKHMSPNEYQLRVTDSKGKTTEAHDPYAFSPVLSEFDLHLFGEGKLYHAYDKLGAHPRVHQGVRGVSFAVWAPNAMRVSVVGDFNQWDGRRHPMRSRGGTGIW